MLEQPYKVRIPLVLAPLKVNSGRKTWMQVVNGGMIPGNRREEVQRGRQEVRKKYAKGDLWGTPAVTTRALVPGTSWKSYRRSHITYNLKEWTQIRSERPLETPALRIIFI